MACLIVLIVTRPQLAGGRESCDVLFRPVLLGVIGSDSSPWLSASAISTALRQMSRARRASPLTAATLRLANCTASGSTMSPGTPSRRDLMILISCSWLYPGKVILVNPVGFVSGGNAVRRNGRRGNPLTKATADLVAKRPLRKVHGIRHGEDDQPAMS